MSNGVHQTHCCIIHGCKYGDEDCPVELGLLTQESPCEHCDGKNPHEVLALCRISDNLKTQSNDCTSLPMFVVQTRRRIYGMDTNYRDECVWIYPDESDEVDEETAGRLESMYMNDNTIDGDLCLDDYTRTAYIDIWEMATVCFTRKGAEDYIKANGHNLTDPRIYVESGYRNSEWEIIRNHLMSITE